MCELTGLASVLLVYGAPERLKLLIDPPAADSIDMVGAAAKTTKVLSRSFC